MVERRQKHGEACVRMSIGSTPKPRLSAWSEQFKRRKRSSVNTGAKLAADHNATTIKA